ncbi:MAG: HEAT repeat domain-containing protein [Verrucomicrobiota bacterium]
MATCLLLLRPNPASSQVTIRSLGNFTSKAQTAVPKLTELLGQREWSGSAAMTLVSIIGTNRSIPLLTKALTNEDKRVRVTLIQILGSFQSESREAIPALLPFTRDEDENLRNPAIQALIKIGAESEVMIPLLVDELADTGSMIRGDVLSALAAFGAEAKAAVPVLLEQIEVLIKNQGQFPKSGNSAIYSARYGGLASGGVASPYSFAPSDSQEFETLRQIDPAAADKIKKHFEKEKAETAKKKK